MTNVEPYNPEFVKKVVQGDKDLKDGKGRKVTVKELNGIMEVIFTLKKHSLFIPCGDTTRLVV